MRLSPLFLTIFFLIACSKENTIESYYSDDEVKGILLQVVKYAVLTEGIPKNDRFNPIYSQRYEKLAASFYFTKYFIDKNNDHYFLLIRPYPAEKKRAIGGRMRLDKENRITEFQEVFVTPLLTEQLALERGIFLFDQWIKNDGILNENYLKMKSYVEWPDSNTYYDIGDHEWKSDFN